MVAQPLELCVDLLRFKSRLQRCGEIVPQDLWRRWKVLEQQLLDLSRRLRTPQIAMEDPTTRRREALGDPPEQIGLVQMMQKAVADNQIGLAQQRTLENLLQGLTGEGNLQLQLLGPLPRHSQHCFGTIDADDSSSGEDFGKPEGDVARATTQIHNEGGRWQRRAARQEVKDPIDGGLIAGTEVSSGIGLDLRIAVHQLRLGAPLHHLLPI